ncbi:MAG: response regulator [Silvanigrellales bacterium]|jgi:CheY-like chemotaxis protein|nr:response regulator [Silvanigrellales bacterium]
MDITQVLRVDDLTRTACDTLPVSLKGLAAELRATFGSRAAQKGLAFEVTFSKAVPDSMETDPVRLRCILFILAENSLQYTEGGFVRVRFDARLEKDGRVRLLLTVHDSGRGMSAPERDGLFPQSDSVALGEAGIDGEAELGLARARRFARDLEGDVEVIGSEVGMGSLFRATLVEKRVEMCERAPRGVGAQESALVGVRVALVDDTLDNREIMGHVLELAGAEVLLAPSGEEALALVAREQPHCVLMDIQMPGMDGYETTRRLRANGFRNAIVALTAHSFREDLQNCLLAGCDSYLRKPVDFQNLVETVRMHCSKETDSGTEA